MALHPRGEKYRFLSVADRMHRGSNTRARSAWVHWSLPVKTHHHYGYTRHIYYHSNVLGRYDYFMLL